MPTPAKARENMTKHTTEAESTAREQAERDVIPDRGGKLKLRKPAFVAKNQVANRYWNALVRSMDGLVLLDDLDSEMLAGYCAMLARRDQTIILVNQLMDSLGVAAAILPLGGKKGRRKRVEDMTDAEYEASAKDGGEVLGPDQLVEAVGKLDSLGGKLQGLERNILSYAEKLGLTPSGRVRLAQRRAEAAAEVDPDGDLFGR